MVRIGHYSLIILLTILCKVSPARAKDFGTYGTIFAIEEEDLLKVIGYSLAELEQSEKLARHNENIARQTEDKLKRPKPINLIESQTARVFYYDPTFIVKEDIKDHKGNLIASKGTKINPLETVSLSKPMVFLDGDNLKQLKWLDVIRNKYKQLTIILAKGEPIKLSEELKEEVYFDQEGLITNKLKVEQIPAIVTQENKLLRIEEVKLEENSNE
jgi:conjugal transfer pilus assembly protein TraW